MNDRRSILVAADAQEAMQLAAEMLASIACEAVTLHGEFCLALAGGTTPQPLYDLLADSVRAESIPWQDTQIFFGDERDVPADHADSNYRMAQDRLLGCIPIRLENLHPMHADVADLDLAAQRYTQRIADRVPAGPDGKPAFDLILLGLGADGHTASLFPGTPAVEEQEKLVVSQFVPILGRNRVTFTLPLINAARNVLFLITGMDKAEAIQRVLSDDPEVARQLPGGRVVPTTGKLMFVLDGSAARQIPKTAS